MRGADFFIVGAPKCGTTSMDAYLAAHPDIYMTLKESHFFAPDVLEPQSFYHREDNYATLFRGRLSERIAGESSVWYLYSRIAARRIHEYKPDSKIIIMLRNPVDVIESYHSQLVFNCEEDILNLSQALAAERGRRESPPDRGTRRPAVILYYRQVVSFYEQVKRYLDTFGRDLVHVIVFEDLVKDTPGTYRRTLEFLGVDAGFAPDFRSTNPNKVARLRPVLKFIRFPPLWLHKSASAVLPRVLLTGLRRGATRLATKYTPRSKMDPDLRRSLSIELRPDVERLSELIDRDLTGWCEVTEPGPDHA